MGDVMVCASRDRLMPVVTSGGEKDVEKGQNLQKQASNR
jgi:hypothetical protein